MKRILASACLAVLFSIPAGAVFLCVDGMEISERSFTQAQGTVNEYDQSAQDVPCYSLFLATAARSAASATTAFNLAVTKGSSWLSVDTTSGTVTATPIIIKFTVDTTSLMPGSFEGELTFTGSFSPVILTVNLTVTDPVLCSLSLSPEGINVTTGSTEKKDIGFQVLCLPETATNMLDWTATVNVLNAPAGSITISPTSGTATADNPSLVTGQVDATQLPGAGVYQAEIVVSANPSVVLPVTVVVRRPGPRLSLSRNAIHAQSVSRGSRTRSQTLTIFNEGSGTLDWSLTGLPTWLTASTDSGSVTSGPPGDSVVLTADPSSFGSGIQNAVLTVSAPEASNSPQLVTVVLLTVPGATPATPEISPSALLFRAVQGQAPPPAQNVEIINVGGGTLSFQCTISMISGGNWLILTGQGGVAPGEVRLFASTVGLPSGRYSATVTCTFPGGVPPLEVGVRLIVAPAGAALRALAVGLPGAAICAPKELELLATTIGSGLSLPVSFPRILTALLVDDCGSGVNNATVVASVEGLNIPLRSLNDGFYNGTWVPLRVAAEVTVTFAALHPTFAKVQRSFTVATATAPGEVSLPVLFADGVVEGAGFAKRRPLAPGGIISLFGEQFATDSFEATQLPLERDLGGGSVRIGDEKAPLFFVGPGQVNAQVPSDVEPGDSVSVAVDVGDRLTDVQNYLIAPVQPGIFFDFASGNAAILDASFRLVTEENPARIGDTLQIYCTGLGATEPAVDEGDPAPAAEPLARVNTPVTVTIGGIDAPVSFAGLAPNFAGLYQVNARVPSGVEPGGAVLLLLEQNGIVANPDLPITIPVALP